MKDRYFYIAIFTYDKDGIAIDFPDLPGCCSCADRNDTEGALRNAQEALGLHIWGMEQEGEVLPQPSAITQISLETGQIPVMVKVFMPPVRARINSRFVKKTVSLPAWLAAKADEDGVNCSRIFQDALKEYLGIASTSTIPYIKNALPSDCE